MASDRALWPAVTVILLVGALVIAWVAYRIVKAPGRSLVLSPGGRLREQSVS